MIEARREFEITTSVPETAFASDVPLVAAKRGNHVETVHRGTIAVCTPDGRVIVGAGDVEQRTYPRSSAKPFQAMALITTGAAESLGLSERDIAIACASHGGEPEHVEAVQGLLANAGLAPDRLRCGIHAPMDAAAARRLSEAGVAPTVLHNNCSGKHAGMLAACKVMGWPLDSYLELSHPLQQLNLETVAAFCGLESGQIDLGTDGCGVPTFYLPIRGIATAFARLATGQGVSNELAEAARRIREAMMAHPFLIAGTRRFDTELMSATSGRIVSKGGAQGCQGIGLVSEGIGLGMKISDGSSVPVGMAAVLVLKSVANLNDNAWSALDRYERADLKNHAGTVVGSLEPVFSIHGPA